MSGLSVTLKGFAELQQRLESLSKEEATKVGQQANRAGAAVLLKKIKEVTPVGPIGEGTPVKHGDGTRPHHKIINALKIKKTKPDTATTVQNTITAGNAFQASMVNFGSIHNAPNPFFQRALDENEQQVINAIGAAIGKRLIKRGV